MRLIELIDDAEEFPIRPEGTDAVLYCRRLPREQMDEINRRYQKVDYRRNARTVYIPEDRVVDVDRDILDYVILRWEGVIGRDGQPVPCTRETKARLPGKIIAEVLEATDAAAAGKGEPDRPNSSRSSSGA